MDVVARVGRVSGAGRLEIQDVDPQGGVLVALRSYQRQTFGRARGESKDLDLGWLDA